MTNQRSSNAQWTKDALRDLATRSQGEWLSFSRRLIQTPSLSGQEAAVAAIIQEEMKQLGYDRVWTDKVGNVNGLMKGGGGPSLLFNGHMDIVDPGPADEWPHPPYSGFTDGDWLWGRGASDMKAALALQIYGLALLRRAAYELPGDCLVTAVVFEETGGLGTRALVQELNADIAVVGEATSNQIARGHRGRLELIVRIKGRPVHASVPDRGVNPHYSMARFLTRLEHIDMMPSDDLGASTVAPTLYGTDQTSANVVPGEAVLHLDWRNVPEESQEDVLNKLRTVLDASLEDGCHGTVGVNVSHFKTYTGYEQDLPREFPGFILPVEHPLILKAQSILEPALERAVPVITWKFATDAAHLVNAGVPTIGFSPASELFPHTTQDRIEIKAMVEGLVGYMALALELGHS